MQIDPILLRHKAEILRRLANHQYEISPSGIRFERMGGLGAGGALETDVNGRDVRIDHNIIVGEGLNYLLNVGLHDATKFSQMYVSLFGTNSAPAGTLTAADYNSTLTELIGYDETARPAFNEAAASGGIVTNSANKAQFTINTTLANWGAALLSDSAKQSAASGQVLFAAVKYAAVRNLQAGDIFGVQYSVTATST